jgi:hypothetical protein
MREISAPVSKAASRRGGGWMPTKARSAGSHDVLAQAPLAADMPLYEGDETEWFDELRGEERKATSAQFAQRLKDLAHSGRLTAAEFEELSQHLH